MDENYYFAPYSAQQIDESIARAAPSGDIDRQLQRKVSTNLLDNWYFGNPVNQRGQTEYTGAGYTIDRWKMGTWQATNPAVTVEDGCIVLSDGTASDTSNSVYLSQYFEAPERFAGKTVTLSVKLRNFEYDSGQVYAFIYANGSLASRARLYLSSANTVTTVTTTLPATLTALSVSFGQMSGSGGKGSFAMEIEAVKLELGDTQTLAHQNAEGNWVLNEIPDYGQELTKCRRYYRQSFDGADPTGKGGWCTFVAGTNNGGAAVSWEDPMRATPSVTVYDSSGVANAVKSWNGAQNPTGIGVNYKTSYGFAIGSTEKFIEGTVYHFHYKASADL